MIATRGGHLQLAHARIVVRGSAEMTRVDRSMAHAIDAAIAEGVLVWGDALRLKQVILNLGDNAIKYSPRRGCVHLALARTATDAVLEIADTGDGIDARHLPHIFDRFYRIDRGAPGKPGTGLGLAIVKRIVEVHRGSVRVTSVPREGSSFFVTLPLDGALSQ